MTISLYLIYIDPSLELDFSALEPGYSYPQGLDSLFTLVTRFFYHVERTVKQLRTYKYLTVLCPLYYEGTVVKSSKK